MAIIGDTIKQFSRFNVYSTKLRLCIINLKTPMLLLHFNQQLKSSSIYLREVKLPVMKFASTHGPYRNKMTCCALFLCIVSANALAQSLPADGTISINPSLLAEIKNYEAYIKQLSATYEIGGHVITIRHKKDKKNDVYELNILSYRFEVKQFSPSACLVIDKIPVLVYDGPVNQPKGNNQVVKYVLDNYLRDVLKSAWVPDSELYKYPQFINQ